MKPRMKQMLRTIVNLCVLMSVFWGDFVTSDRGPNIKREGMKIPMIRWLKTMFPCENDPCENAKFRYNDSYLKNNERNCGHDDQYGQPYYGDKKLRSIFYQVTKLQLLELYF